MKDTVHVRLDVPRAQHRTLKAEAAKQGKTIKEFLQELLDRELGKPAK